QMRRLHGRRVRNRNGSRARSAAAAAASSITTPAESEPAERIVVKSKQFDVKPMGVDEAALQMELLGHDFFLFTLADSGRCAVVYRRRGGDLGLIEASRQQLPRPPR